MKWIEKHINGFFLLNGIVLLLIVVFGIWAVLLLSGVPHNSPTSWTPYQWKMIDFLWKPTLVYSVIYLLFAILCFMKKYFAFPVIALFLCFSIKGTIENVAEIFKYGLIYPVNNLLGVFGVLALVLSIIGIVIWVRKLRRH